MCSAFRLAKIFLCVSVLLAAARANAQPLPFSFSGLSTRAPICSDGVSGLTNTCNNLPTVYGRTASPISVTPGLLAIGTTDVTATVAGVLVGDTLICNLSASPALGGGVSMTECHVSAANTVTFRFVATPLGVTVGSFSYNVVWLR